MAFYTPSKASSAIPNYGDEQLTTMVHLHRHDISSPGASYKRSVHEDITSTLRLVLGKPRHHRIPLPSQTENDITTAVDPLLRRSRGEMLMELGFGRSLSKVRVFGHKDFVNEAATSPPLPSLAGVHPKLPWPVVIQRSGGREWVTVAEAVEILWSALQIPIPLRTSASLLKDQGKAMRTVTMLTRVRARKRAVTIDESNYGESNLGTVRLGLYQQLKNLKLRSPKVSSSCRIPARPNVDVCEMFRCGTMAYASPHGLSVGTGTEGRSDVEYTGRMRQQAAKLLLGDDVHEGLLGANPSMNGDEKKMLLEGAVKTAFVEEAQVDDSPVDDTPLISGRTSEEGS
ncbi:hypothetical protein EDD85DRAFT_797575 [Armillaria nabsnona]|nr:hypothetical protein EDD85DRAFT_797575 [Armillaria nabsnona]